MAGLFDGNLESVMLLVVTVCSVWLLFRSMGWGVSLSTGGARQGMANWSATELGFSGIRSDGAAVSNYTDTAGQSAQYNIAQGASANATGADAFRSRRKRSGFVNGQYDSPSFWNPGSFAAVSEQQLADIGLEGQGMNIGSAPGSATTSVGLTPTTAAAFVSNGSMSANVQPVSVSSAGGVKQGYLVHPMTNGNLSYADGFATNLAMAGSNNALVPY